MRDGRTAGASIRVVAAGSVGGARRDAPAGAPEGEPRRVAHARLSHAETISTGCTSADAQSATTIRWALVSATYAPRAPIATPPGSWSPRTQVVTRRSARSSQRSESL